MFFKSKSIWLLHVQSWLINFHTMIYLEIKSIPFWLLLCNHDVSVCLIPKSLSYLSFFFVFPPDRNDLKWKHEVILLSPFLSSPILPCINLFFSFILLHIIYINSHLVQWSRNWQKTVFVPDNNPNLFCFTLMHV